MMIKKLNIILQKSFFIFTLAFSTVVNAYVNEPDGFRNIKWGSSFTENESEMIVQDSSDTEVGVKYFIRKNDKLEIGQAKLDGVIYRYKDNQLVGIIGIVTKGSTNRVNLKLALEAQFGDGYQSNKYIQDYQWMGKVTYIKLKCDFQEQCTLLMESMVAKNERLRKSDQSAKDAAKDF